MFDVDTERLDIRPPPECDETLYCDLLTDADTFPVDEVWTQYAADHLKAERLVIAAGLSRCFDPEACGEGPDKRVWSAHRSSWGQSVSANR